MATAEEQQYEAKLIALTALLSAQSICLGEGVPRCDTSGSRRSL
jgi:hypothetical protein